MKPSPALRALLARIIDYAGLYPPASLSCEITTANFESYAHGEHAWMLRNLVVGTVELPNIPTSLDGKLAVLAETDLPRAGTLETKAILHASRPTYCEVSIENLDHVKTVGCFAKIRTGGVKPEMIPSCEAVAAFILACAEKNLAFKATAGLHHPVRSMQPLTYEANPPRAMLHGFLNVFLASSFAWNGERRILPILEETDVASFRFDDRAHWRDKSLSIPQIENARANFCHSFGSCSFVEPVQDLQALGLL